MDLNMNGTLEEKNGKFRRLTLDRGGWHGERVLTPEEWLDRALRTWGAAGRSADNKHYATRATADIAQRLRFPERIPARIIREALEEGADTLWARQFGAIMTEYADRVAERLHRRQGPPRVA